MVPCDAINDNLAISASNPASSTVTLVIEFITLRQSVFPKTSSELNFNAHIRAIWDNLRSYFKLT